MSTRTHNTDSTTRESILFSIFTMLLTKLGALNSFLGKAVRATELLGVAKYGYEPNEAILKNDKLSVQVAQTGRVMDVIMIAVFVIVGVFVVATVYNDVPDTGVTDADNAVDNFTTDTFSNFELFGTVILLIIIVLVVFYVRQMQG